MPPGQYSCPSDEGRDTRDEGRNLLSYGTPTYLGLLGAAFPGQPSQTQGSGFYGILDSVLSQLHHFNFLDGDFSKILSSFGDIFFPVILL